MPVPSKMQDLSTLAASNSPAGSDAIGNSLDDYLRAIQSIVRSTNALSSATLASASTTDLGTSDAESVQITGGTPITSFGTSVAGLVRECRFTATLTIVNSSAIALPGGSNIVTNAGDVIRFRSLGSGNWIFVSGTNGGFLPLSGGTLSGSLVVGGNVTVNSALVCGSANLVIATSAGAGAITFRPNGLASTTGQMILDNGGNVSVAGTFSSGSVITSQRMDIYTSAAPATQSQSRAIGWNNVVPRWKEFLESDASYSLYSYNTVGTGIANALRISQAGAGVFAASVSAPVVTQTSDGRLKDINGTFDPRDLTSVRIADYTWKSTGLRGVSPIAQEVQLKSPEYVHEGDDGTLSVDKAGLALERVAYLEGILKKAGLL